MDLLVWFGLGLLQPINPLGHLIRKLIFKEVNVSMYDDFFYSYILCSKCPIEGAERLTLKECFLWAGSAIWLEHLYSVLCIMRHVVRGGLTSPMEGKQDDLSIRYFIHITVLQRKKTERDMGHVFFIYCFEQCQQAVTCRWSMVDKLCYLITLSLIIWVLP